jgi:hypothetical protein
MRIEKRAWHQAGSPWYHTQKPDLGCVRAGFCSGDAVPRSTSGGGENA